MSNIKNEYGGIDVPIDLEIDNMSIWSQYGKKPNEIKLYNPRVKRACASCKVMEKSKKFKNCRRCTFANFPEDCIAFYCGEECQTKHWKYHRFEHKIYESNPELFQECLLKNGDMHYIKPRDEKFYSETSQQKYVVNKRYSYDCNKT